MKFLVNRIVLTLVIGAMAVTMAFGKTRRDTVTFTENVKLNSTLLKSGTYDVAFNEETNELAIIKNGKVVAKTAAKAEPRTGKASQTEVKTVTTNSGVELIGVAFGGTDKNIMVDRSGDTAKN